MNCIGLVFRSQCVIKVLIHVSNRNEWRMRTFRLKDFKETHERQWKKNNFCFFLVYDWKASYIFESSTPYTTVRHTGETDWNLGWVGVGWGDLSWWYIKYLNALEETNVYHGCKCNIFLNLSSPGSRSWIWNLNSSNYEINFPASSHIHQIFLVFQISLILFSCFHYLDYQT